LFYPHHEPSSCERGIRVKQKKPGGRLR